jgi:N6-adenosine-specific RNA methylase IME4
VSGGGKPREVLVRAINVRARIRALREETVAALMESMATQGQIASISICYPNGQVSPVLVAGRHRLEAAKRLKWEAIDAVEIAHTSDDQTRLIEIDENLIRGELSPAERAIHVAERKRVYEALHPETRQGGAAGNKGGGRGKAPIKEAESATLICSFSDDTSARIGRSARSLREDSARAKHIPRLADTIGTTLDKGEELDALAKLSVEEQAKVIDKAAAGEKVSARPVVKRLRRASREAELAENTRAASALAGHKLYGVIYADPPWRFEPYSRETGMDRAADNHYPTMTTDDIAAMKIPAADDCVLFLWATAPMAPDALRVMAAWGFTYKSQAVWVKDRPGTGYWFRNQHEVLMVGTRGNIPAPAPGERFGSVIAAPVGRHSAKPFRFAEIIEELFPNAALLELFAREGRAGWDSWGLEAPEPVAEQAA